MIKTGIETIGLNPRIRRAKIMETGRINGNREGKLLDFANWRGRRRLIWELFLVGVCQLIIGTGKPQEILLETFLGGERALGNSNCQRSACGAIIGFLHQHAKKSSLSQMKEGSWGLPCSLPSWCWMFVQPFFLALLRKRNTLKRFWKCLKVCGWTISLMML